MSRRKKVVHEEEHENHERWLITYADMITLLMVLFIVLFAMSTVEEKKFNALKEGLAAGFGQSTSMLDGSSSILEEPGTTSTEPIQPDPNTFAAEIAEIKLQAATEAMAQHNQRRYADAEAEAERLRQIEEQILAVLREKNLEDDVRTLIDGRGLTVSLVSRHVVFEANLATLSPRGRLIVDTIAPVLLAIDDELAVEGHTNQAPGAPRYFASDWDLSAARAVSVLRRLNENLGVPASRLSAVGYGKIRPLVDPGEPGSQQLNKRVDIVVKSGLDEENRELLARVMDDRAHPVSSGPGDFDDTDGTDDTGGHIDDSETQVIRTGKGAS